MKHAPHILAALLAVVGGCASAPATRESPAVSPGARAQETGLEVSWWVIDDAPAGETPAREVFAELAQRSVPVAWTTVDAWRANGLRLYSVPVGEVDALRARFHLAGPTQSQWLGEAPRWRDLARSQPIRAPLAIGLDDGPIVLQNGHLRLAVRCWTAPSRIQVEAGSASRVLSVIQLECVPQHLPEPERAPAFVLPSPDGKRPAPPEPFTFSRLTLSTALLGDEAIIIVPEAPEADPAQRTLGPTPPSPPTLGEAILMDPAADRARRTRVVIVLTPNVAPEFKLIARDDR